MNTLVMYVKEGKIVDLWSNELVNVVIMDEQKAFCEDNRLSYSGIIARYEEAKLNAKVHFRVFPIMKGN